MSSDKLSPRKCLLSSTQHHSHKIFDSREHREDLQSYSNHAFFLNPVQSIFIFTVGFIIIFSLRQANLKPTTANYYVFNEIQKDSLFKILHSNLL